MKKFHHLLSQYQEEEETLKEKMRVQLAEALKKDGIYGNAVESNLEGSVSWEKEKLDQFYRLLQDPVKKHGYKAFANDQLYSGNK